MEKDYENCNQTKNSLKREYTVSEQGPASWGTVEPSTYAVYLTGWIPLMGEVFLTTESE